MEQNISGDKAKMPMTERFYSVNGQMMGYESGGVKKDFLTDHLGSITAEIEQTQTRTYDTRYSAYGRNNWSTGTGCGFGWVGSYGYRETGLLHMSHYVRARHYSYVTGGWSTVDPLWPDESAYGYVGGRATDWTDHSGLGPGIIGGWLVNQFPRNGCDKNTREYQDKCNKTGNKLDCCAAMVSGAICLAIKTGKLADQLADHLIDSNIPPIPIPNPWGINLDINKVCHMIKDGWGVPDLVDATQCQNDCMIDIWRKRNTPAWIHADKMCKKFGQTSVECCRASVNAEQDNYDRCAPKCFPGLAIIPKPIRVGFAIELLNCCGK